VDILYLLLIGYPEASRDRVAETVLVNAP